MNTIKYNNTRISYNSYTSVFDSVLECNIVSLFLDDKNVATIMLSNKDLKKIQ
jgi:hypothetical protein